MNMWQAPSDWRMVVGDVEIDLREYLIGERRRDTLTDAARFMWGGPFGEQRDGLWRMSEPPRATYGAYREFDGWWRVATDAERRSLRGVTIACETHGPEFGSDACGAARSRCVQVMVCSGESARRYRRKATLL